MYDKNNPLKVVTLCSGYDSQCMALDKIKASGVSESQQYKMAGNSIVVDVLYYIFTNMFINTEKPQDTLF